MRPLASLWPHRAGQVRSGQVRSGRVRSGQGGPGAMCDITLTLTLTLSLSPSHAHPRPHPQPSPFALTPTRTLTLTPQPHPYLGHQDPAPDGRVADGAPAGRKGASDTDGHDVLAVEGALGEPNGLDPPAARACHWVCRWGAPSAECRVQGAGCRVQGAGCRVQGTWYGPLGPADYRVQGTGCELLGPT